MTAEIHALAGAYAANALTPDERDEFERHLSECETCAHEVPELQETLARLARAAAQEPPPALRNRVLAEVNRVRPLPPRLPTVPRLEHRAARRMQAAVLAAAAAVVALAVALGAVTAELRGRLEDAQEAQRQLAAVFTAEDVRTRTVPITGGGSATVGVSLAQDRAVLVASGMPQPPDDRTYQLWLIGPQGPRSAGLVSPESNGYATHVASVEASGASAAALTVEPEGGSTQPTSDPIWTAPL